MFEGLLLTPEQRKQIWNREYSPDGGMWGMDEITEAIATRQLKAVTDYLASLSDAEMREEVAKFLTEQNLKPYEDRMTINDAADSILTLRTVKRAEFRPIEWPESMDEEIHLDYAAGYNQAQSDLKAKYPQLYYKEG
jgi:hypothetical protein